MRPRGGRPDRNILSTRTRYAGRRRSRAGLFLIPAILVILVTVFFFGSFLVSRAGQLLMESAEPLAELPIVGGGPEKAEVWKNKDRVNLLLLGTDQRDNEKGQPSRTDTILVMSIDPATKTAAMLGIPRDTWVRIPLEGGRWIEGKVNTAHFYGEANKYPGGGPALARKTIENLLGIKVHYVARIDFAPFEQMIDAVDGVNVEVEKPLKDDEYPTANYGIERIFVPAGLQHLNGTQALRYVRSRHQDSDFGRMKRQQQVLVAMREKAMGLGMITALPKLIGQFKDMIYTDLTPAEALALAKIAGEVDTTNMNSRSLDATCCVSPITTIGGEEALMPNPAAVKKLVSEVFTTTVSLQSTAVKP